MDFDGKNVVVTGATGALGRAVVALLGERGATCHIPVRGTTVPGDFGGARYPRVEVTPGVDLTDAEAVAAFYAPLDGLWASINIAGGFAMAPVAETSGDDFLGQFTLNALSCFLCCRQAAMKMRRTGTGGRLVNVAARPALEPRGGAGMVAYTSAKAAVAALTQSLGEELAGENILVNAVAPSILDTPANRAAMPGADFDTWPKVAEVASTIAHLASPQNKAARSAVVPVYGRA